MANSNANEFGAPRLIHEKMTMQFARYLCEGHFDKAHAMLSTELKATLTSQVLKEKYIAMVRGYSDCDSDKADTASFKLPTDYDLNIETALQDYPNMESTGDIGWAYCSICGDGFSEAVAATVSRVLNPDQMTSKLVITDVEWGRP